MHGTERFDFRTGGGLRAALFDKMLGAGEPERAPRLPPGQRLGSWEIGERIGSGGSASVYLGKRFEGGVEQTAAIKVRPLAADDDPLSRREIEVVASLNHPYIVSLIEAGATQDDLAWFAIALVDGEPITEYLQHARPAWRERVVYFDRLCSAVEHAHARDVVHRDIKPSNVFIDVHGLPKLLDFGIALSGGEGGADWRMTPAYASPEQRQGAAVTARSDIYQLGLLLRDICPLDAAGADALHVNGLVLADLRRIVTRATEIEPSRRYDSVSALRADLARLLARQPLAGTQTERLYRLERLVERNALATATAAVGVVLLLAAAGGFAVRLAQERDTALANEAHARQMLRFLSSTLTQTDPFQRDAASTQGGHPLTLVDAMDAALQRLVRDTQLRPGDRTVLRATIGVIFAENGDNARCRDLLDSAPSRADLERAGPAEQLQHYATYAECAFGAAKAEEAQAASAKAIALAQRLPTSATVAEGQARAFIVAGQGASNRGDLAQAQQEYERALHAAEAGESAYLQWQALRFLTETRMNLAAWASARTVAERLVALSASQFGRDSPEHLQASVLLLTILRYAGENALAAQLLEHVEDAIGRIDASQSYEIPFSLRSDVDGIASDVAFDAGRFQDGARLADAGVALLLPHDGYLLNRFNLLASAELCYVALGDGPAAVVRSSAMLDNARQRFPSNHLGMAGALRYHALAQFLAGHLADARATLGQALAERQQYPSARPALDIGLAALEAALSREEGCAARAAAFGALAQWATAYGPSEVRSSKITHLLLARPGPATVRSACATP